MDLGRQQTKTWWAPVCAACCAVLCRPALLCCTVVGLCHAALAGWLPGRTAEGVKQAMNSHIIGHEGKMMIRLKGMKLPASFPELLELWPDLESLQVRH